jgi:hypothetical protein
MRNLLIIALIISTYFVIMNFGRIPSEYPAYPDKSTAAMKFVNYSGDGLASESHVQFTLVTSLPACDESTLGHVDIKTDGTIGICVEGGWVTK